MSPPADLPPEALEAVETAARRWEELRARDRELCFVLGPGRVEIEVRTRDGLLVDRIAPSDALAVAAGADL